MGARQTPSEFPHSLGGYRPFTPKTANDRVAQLAEPLTVSREGQFDLNLATRMVQNHMWTAAACKGFEERCGDLVGCGHMSGPFVRRIRPLALMEFADRVPIKTSR